MNRGAGNAAGHRRLLCTGPDGAACCVTGARHFALVILFLATSLCAPAPVISLGQTSTPTPSFFIYLPLIRQDAPPCPATSPRQYAIIPVLPPVTDRPAAQHADLNLALRGAQPVAAPLTLVDYGGATDPDAPQLAGIFSDDRTPTFVSAAQVRAWDWMCGTATGCRGEAITWPPVTLLAVRTMPDEPLAIPDRAAEIFGGGYVALVLYAEEQRLTLKYTREDNVVYGYTVHLEALCVDPNLLATYRRANSQGRSSLPGLRNGQAVGSARGGQVQVAVRDVGAFMDPRSRKDWWQDR